MISPSKKSANTTSDTTVCQLSSDSIISVSPLPYAKEIDARSLFSLPNTFVLFPYPSFPEYHPFATVTAISFSLPSVTYSVTS